MASDNWSMSIAGYPAHTRSGVAVIGVAPMSTFAAMRVAAALGLGTGWFHAEGGAPPIEGLRPGATTFVDLGKAFADRLVVQTEGVATGSLVFAAAGQDAGEPLSPRSLIAWAEAKGRPWIEVIDNEVSYWGGLDAKQQTRLLSWFLAQRPVEADWTRIAIEPKLAKRLLSGTFEHGWSRNLGLARKDRQDLWGGLPSRSVLACCGSTQGPSRVEIGLRLRLSLGEWDGRDLAERCPLDDEHGRYSAWSGEY